MAAIGKLDRRITLMRITEINTPRGPVEEERAIGKVWASRVDASDGEKAVANTVQGTVVARFVVRRTRLTTSISPKDRLKEGGRVFAITGIKERERSFLEITAEARLD